MDNRPCAELTMEWFRPEGMLPPWLGGGISESNPDDEFKYEEPPPVLNKKSIYFFLHFD